MQTYNHLSISNSYYSLYREVYLASHYLGVSTTTPPFRYRSLSCLGSATFDNAIATYNPETDFAAIIFTNSAAREMIISTENTDVVLDGDLTADDFEYESLPLLCSIGTNPSNSLDYWYFRRRNPMPSLNGRVASQHCSWCACELQTNESFYVCSACGDTLRPYCSEGCAKYAWYNGTYIICLLTQALNIQESGKDSSELENKLRLCIKKQKKCACCLKNSTKTCGLCFSVSYCDKDCQKANWGYHKKYCALFRVLRDIVLKRTEMRKVDTVIKNEHEFAPTLRELFFNGTVLSKTPDLIRDLSARVLLQRLFAASTEVNVTEIAPQAIAKLDATFPITATLVRNHQEQVATDKLLITDNDQKTCKRRYYDEERLVLPLDELEMQEELEKKEEETEQLLFVNYLEELISGYHRDDFHKNQNDINKTITNDSSVNIQQQQQQQQQQRILEKTSEQSPLSQFLSISAQKFQQFQQVPKSQQNTSRNFDESTNTNDLLEQITQQSNTISIKGNTTKQSTSISEQNSSKSTSPSSTLTSYSLLHSPQTQKVESHQSAKEQIITSQGNDGLKNITSNHESMSKESSTKDKPQTVQSKISQEGTDTNTDKMYDSIKLLNKAVPDRLASSLQLQSKVKEQLKNYTISQTKNVMPLMKNNISKSNGKLNSEKPWQKDQKNEVKSNVTLNKVVEDQKDRKSESQQTKHFIFHEQKINTSKLPIIHETGILPSSSPPKTPSDGQKTGRTFATESTKKSVQQPNQVTPSNKKGSQLSNKQENKALPSYEKPPHQKTQSELSSEFDVLLVQLSKHFETSDLDALWLFTTIAKNVDFRGFAVNLSKTILFLPIRFLPTKRICDIVDAFDMFFKTEKEGSLTAHKAHNDLEKFRAYSFYENVKHIPFDKFYIASRLFGWVVTERKHFWCTTTYGINCPTFSFSDLILNALNNEEFNTTLEKIQHMFILPRFCDSSAKLLLPMQSYNNLPSKPQSELARHSIVLLSDYHFPGLLCDFHLKVSEITDDVFKYLYSEAVLNTKTPPLNELEKMLILLKFSFAILLLRPVYDCAACTDSPYAHTILESSITSLMESSCFISITFSTASEVNPDMLPAIEMFYFARLTLVNLIPRISISKVFDAFEILFIKTLSFFQSNDSAKKHLVSNAMNSRPFRPMKHNNFRVFQDEGKMFYFNADTHAVVKYMNEDEVTPLISSPLQHKDLLQTNAIEYYLKYLTRESTGMPTTPLEHLKSELLKTHKFISQMPSDSKENSPENRKNDEFNELIRQFQLYDRRQTSGIRSPLMKLSTLTDIDQDNKSLTTYLQEWSIEQDEQVELFSAKLENIHNKRIAGYLKLCILQSTRDIKLFENAKAVCHAVSLIRKALHSPNLLCWEPFLRLLHFISHYCDYYLLSKEQDFAVQVLDVIKYGIYLSLQKDEDNFVQNIEYCPFFPSLCHFVYTKDIETITELNLNNCFDCVDAILGSKNDNMMATLLAAKEYLKLINTEELTVEKLKEILRFITDYIASKQEERRHIFISYSKISSHLFQFHRNRYINLACCLALSAKEQKFFTIDPSFPGNDELEELQRNLDYFTLVCFMAPIPKEFRLLLCERARSSTVSEQMLVNDSSLICSQLLDHRNEYLHRTCPGEMNLFDFIYLEQKEVTPSITFSLSSFFSMFSLFNSPFRSSVPLVSGNVASEKLTVDAYVPFFSLVDENDAVSLLSNANSYATNIKKKLEKGDTRYSADFYEFAKQRSFIETRYHDGVYDTNVQCNTGELTSKFSQYEIEFKTKDKERSEFETVEQNLVAVIDVLKSLDTQIQRRLITTPCAFEFICQHGMINGFLTSPSLKEMLLEKSSPADPQNCEPIKLSLEEKNECEEKITSLKAHFEIGLNELKEKHEEFNQAIETLKKRFHSLSMIGLEEIDKTTRQYFEKLDSKECFREMLNFQVAERDNELYCYFQRHHRKKAIQRKSNENSRTPSTAIDLSTIASVDDQSFREWMHSNAERVLPILFSAFTPTAYQNKKTFDCVVSLTNTLISLMNKTTPLSTVTNLSSIFDDLKAAAQGDDVKSTVTDTATNVEFASFMAFLKTTMKSDEDLTYLLTSNITAPDPKRFVFQQAPCLSNQKEKKQIQELQQKQFNFQKAAKPKNTALASIVSLFNPSFLYSNTERCIMMLLGSFYRYYEKKHSTLTKEDIINYFFFTTKTALRNIYCIISSTDEKERGFTGISTLQTFCTLAFASHNKSIEDFSREFALRCFTFCSQRFLEKQKHANEWKQKMQHERNRYKMQQQAIHALETTQSKVALTAINQRQSATDTDKSKTYFTHRYMDPLTIVYGNNPVGETFDSLFKIQEKMKKEHVHLDMRPSEDDPLSMLEAIEFVANSKTKAEKESYFFNESNTGLLPTVSSETPELGSERQVKIETENDDMPFSLAPTELQAKSVSRFRIGLNEMIDPLFEATSDASFTDDSSDSDYDFEDDDIYEDYGVCNSEERAIFEQLEQAGISREEIMEELKAISQK